MPNTENINKVIEALRKDQAIGTHFIMRDYGQYIDALAVPEGEEGSYQTCNTAMCIAGWANLLRVQEDNPELLKSEDFMDYEVDSVSNARNWLGIDPYQAGDLFIMDSSAISPSRFDHLDRDVRYKAGIRVLEILRDEGRVNWDRALREAGYSF